MSNIFFLLLGFEKSSIRAEDVILAAQLDLISTQL